MKRAFIGFLIIGMVFLVTRLCPAGESLPTASEVTGRMVERARKIAGQTERYTYEKKMIIEVIDSRGRVDKSTVKVHQVKLIAGLPFSRLIRIQGRELSEEELRKEDKREEEFRKKTTSVDMKKMAERKESWLTPELIDKFEFTVRERTILNGRPTLRLEFSPAAGIAEAKSLQDKILGRLAGSLWVDEEEAETARFSVRLQKPISLGWFGMLGSLHQFDMDVERVRMPDGVWINGKQSTHLAGRKLFSPMRVRTMEESSGFMKE